jgi:hypothetical protein
MATAKISKLEAVNMLLDSIGEEPVNSLESGLADADKAARKIDEISREIQSRGYDCNTSYELVLTRNQDGNVPLPNDTLKVDTSGIDEDLHVGTRGGFLYDLGKNTLVFTKDVTVDVVHLLPFEDLPFELQNFIVCRAGRVFQEGIMGSTSLDGFTKRRETEAQAAWEGAVADTEDSNVLRDSPSAWVISARRNRIAGT